MPTLKKNHGHESDVSRKGKNIKSKRSKSPNVRGRSENQKSGEMITPNREGNLGNR
ncbi:MAG: hypothetical protein Q8891_01860 [Bacteroidota bacterium]|nr:hypothetical protein [Bacteroidota bacterium]